MKKGDKAQVWIETVIYTLIGLVVIGLLLAFAKPKIDSMRDKAVIEQTLSSFAKINSNLNEIQLEGPENSRQNWLKISKGTLTINPLTNKISWIIQSSYKYSEPGYVVSSGELKINTTQLGSSSYSIEIFKIYNFNITVNNAYYTKEIAQSSNQYSLIVKNKGIDETGSTLIDISI
jgi:type II secretory pathway pseudopilin PulG